MPLTINTIGTRYSGQANIVTRQGRCRNCGRVAQLTSYDTRLFFVVLFIPIIPLGRKRINNLCSACRHHTVVPLARWEKERLEKLGGAVADWSARRDDPALAEQAVGTAVAFDAKEEFLGIMRKFTPGLAANAGVMATVGDAYGHFCMRDEQIAAYRASLASVKSPEVERALGVQLIGAGDGDEGVALVRSAVRSGVSNPGQAAFAVVGFLQSRGNHAEALEVLSELAQASPAAAADKMFAKLKKASEKNLNSGAPVKGVAPVMADWTGPKPEVPQNKRLAFIGVAIAVIAVVVMVITMVVRTTSPDTWLVNGLSVMEKVSVDGHTYTLGPLSAQKVPLAQGTHVVKVIQPAGLIPDQTVEISTPLLTRAFNNPTFAINPDELAVLLEREVVYSYNGSAQNIKPKWELHRGKVLHTFHVDYGFVSHPPRIDLKSTTSVETRTKVDVYRDEGAEIVLASVYAKEGEAAAKELTIKGLTRDPWNEGYAYGVALLQPSDAIAVLEPLLKVRPVVTTTHRLYQEMRKRVDARYDLHGQYKAMYDADPKDPALTYLLGRVSEGEEHDRLFAQAAEATPVVPAAVAGWARVLLDRGEFEKTSDVARRCRSAGAWSEAAAECERYAFIAQGKYKEALELPELACIVRGLTGRTAREKIALIAMTGKVRDAHLLAAEIAKAEINRPDEMTGYLGSVCDYAAGDVEAAAKALEGASPELDARALLMRGRVIDAAKAIDAIDHPPFELLLEAGVCAIKAGNRKLAAEFAENAAKQLEPTGPEGKVAAQLLCGKIDCTPQAIDKVWLEYLERPAFFLLAAAARPNSSEAALRAAEVGNRLEVFPSREVRAGIERLRGK